MRLPKTIATWCVVLFFLVYGINAFVAVPSFVVIAGVLAIGVAVFTFLGR